MLTQFFNLVFLKAFVFQFVNYAILTVAFFTFFALINNIRLALKVKPINNNKVLSN